MSTVESSCCRASLALHKTLRSFIFALAVMLMTTPSVFADPSTIYVAGSTFYVKPGSTIVTDVWLNPNSSKTPAEIMLQFRDEDESWEHRAYWGDDYIHEGAPGTPSRKRMGDLPETGVWKRLEFKASEVGLDGRWITGMSYDVFDGEAAWVNTAIIAPDAGTDPGGTNPVRGAPQIDILATWKVEPGKQNTLRFPVTGENVRVELIARPGEPALPSWLRLTGSRGNYGIRATVPSSFNGQLRYRVRAWNDAGEHFADVRLVALAPTPSPVPTRQPTSTPRPQPTRTPTPSDRTAPEIVLNAAPAEVTDILAISGEVRDPESGVERVEVWAGTTRLDVSSLTAKPAVHQLVVSEKLPNVWKIEETRQVRVMVRNGVGAAHERVFNVKRVAPRLTGARIEPATSLRLAPGQEVQVNMVPHDQLGNSRFERLRLNPQNQTIASVGSRTPQCNLSTHQCSGTLKAVLPGRTQVRVEGPNGELLGTINVEVANAGVEILQPRAGTMHASSLTVQGTLFTAWPAAARPQKAKLYVDGKMLPQTWVFGAECRGSLCGTASESQWSFTVDTSSLSDGSHELAVQILDSDNRGHDSGSVRVEIRKLGVQIVRPYNRMAIAGTVRLTSEIVGAAAGHRVEYFLDAEAPQNKIGEARQPTNNQYVVDWNTCRLMNNAAVSDGNNRTVHAVVYNPQNVKVASHQIIVHIGNMGRCPRP